MRYQLRACPTLFSADTRVRYRVRRTVPVQMTVSVSSWQPHRPTIGHVCTHSLQPEPNRTQTTTVTQDASKTFYRVLGFQRGADHTNLSYVKTLAETTCESIDLTIPKERLSVAGTMARQNKGRPSRRVIFAQVASRKKPGPVGRSSNWLRTPRDDLVVFRSAPKVPRKIPHGSLELKPYCGSMQQIRQAIGSLGASSKHPNVSWPGGTYGWKIKRAPVTHKTEGGVGGVGKTLVKIARRRRQAGQQGIRPTSRWNVFM